MSDGSRNTARREAVAALLLCGVGVAVIAQAARLPFGSWDEPGASFFPVLSGGLLACLSLITFLKSVLGPPADGERWRIRERWRPLAAVVAILVAYALTLDVLGFVVATFALLVLLFRLMGAGRLPVVAAGSLVATVIVYWAFRNWLGVQLPAGLLGF